MTEATDDERKQIHLLASEPESVNLSRQAQSDLLSYGLTKADVCDEIVTWIDAGERVKVTTLHSYMGLIGQKAFELKPRIEGRIYYVKVMIQISSDTKQLLLIISTHLNH